MPRWILPVYKTMNRVMFAVAGSRMRIQGSPLLQLETIGAWFFNLARRPDDAWATIEGKRVAVRAESLSGDERARAWERIVALAPGYGKYTVDTDREIPIVRLTPKVS
jgi:hypothetical protein